MIRCSTRPSISRRQSTRQPWIRLPRKVLLLHRLSYRRFPQRPHRYLSRPLRLICQLLLCTPFLDRCPCTNIKPRHNPQLFKILHLPSSPHSSGIRSFQHLGSRDSLRNRSSRLLHSMWVSRTCCVNVTSRKRSYRPSEFEASQTAYCLLHWMTLWMDSATRVVKPWGSIPLRTSSINSNLQRYLKRGVRRRLQSRQNKRLTLSTVLR